VKVDPAVLPALLLDLADPEPPDLAGRAHVRAAAGLEVQRVAAPADADEPDSPLTHRRLDLHRLHHLGLGSELGLGDPLRGYGKVGGHVVVEERLDRRDVIRRLGHVEVETALVLADLPAGNAEGERHRQEVERAVHAHQPMAPLPVETEGDRLAGRRECRAGSRLVQDAGAVAVGVDRAGDGSPADAAGVAGLAAGTGVKKGAVELDPLGTGADHRRGGFREVGVVTEE
jgi:hypothetical protein